MLEALIAKFSEPEKQTKLLSTGNAILVEDSPHDQFWGVGEDGDGENKLGLMLVAVREAYRNSQAVDIRQVSKSYYDLKKKYQGYNYGQPDPKRQTEKPKSITSSIAIKVTGFVLLLV